MKFIPKHIRETADISRGDRSLRSFLLNTLSVIIVLGTLYIGLGFLADLAAEWLPERWEVRILSDLPEGEPEEIPGFDRARALFDDMLGTTELRPLDYRLFLLDLDEPNAVAIPGGGVGVTAELLSRVESEIGLATVLAHELGHHQGRHNLKQLGRTLLLRSALALLFKGGGGSMLGTSLTLAESSHSRHQETEADEFALRMVREHFGHTEGSLEFFELIREEYEAGGGKWGAFLSNHPLTQDRIDHLHQLERELSDRPAPAVP